MPGKVKVKICAGKNLPVMDRSSDTTDAYVEIKLANTTYKTDVCKKSLNPQWNTDWYRFEVDDSELQDEPLQIRVMDHDTYSANDAIGKVYLNLNPLLLPFESQNVNPAINGENTYREISGWIPVYDTMHGIRGEVNIVVKVELFSDFNRFRQSSCGVQFFYSSIIPEGFTAKAVHGFVEELVVNDDPEYQWIDKIRTPRASNEARQTLFFKLSGQLQRKIGVKTLNLGGNAVIGYKLSYDLEGESGIVARGIGTAVTLIKSINTGIILNKEDIQDECKNSSTQTTILGDQPTTELNQLQRKDSPEKTSISVTAHFPSHRRSSDSDLSITPRGSSLTGSDKSYGYLAGYYMRGNVHRSHIQENFDMLEYPFLTLFRYPQGSIKYIGGTVSARSVKRLETITNVEEPESRDTWWSELRMEIRSHARALNCNAVLGYSEDASISDDICVLSAYGTAAVLDFHYSDDFEEGFTSGRHKDLPNLSHPEKELNNLPGSFKNFESPEHFVNNLTNSCSITHVTYDNNIIPLKANIMKCAICGTAKVPEVLISTIEPSDNMPYSGRGCVIESYVCRPLREQKGEALAKEISDALPFLEYELHRLLINKLKIKGMNAIFGLKFNISVGEKCITCLVTGTAVYLLSLPSPVLPKLISNQIYSEKKLSALQKHLNDTTKRNKQFYKIKENVQNVRNISESENEEQIGSLDLSSQKDTCVLEIGDPEDEELLKLLIEDCVPEGFSVVNTEFIPGMFDQEISNNLQMFTQFYRVKFHPSFGVNKYFHRLLQSIYFKLRRLTPCAICKLQFHVSIPEPDELQLCVYGMALAIKKKQKRNKSTGSRKNDEDLIFKLDEEDQAIGDLTNITIHKNYKNDPKFPVNKIEKIVLIERYGIDITPLSFIPGGIIDKYLGNLNFFFIRETTSIREEGGPSGFVHSFISEVLSLLRAHVTALGGNALIAFFFSEQILIHNLHKNQGQCLVNVGGDVVYVSYNNEP